MPDHACTICHIGQRDKASAITHRQNRRYRCPGG